MSLRILTEVPVVLGARAGSASMKFVHEDWQKAAAEYKRRHDLICEQRSHVINICRSRMREAGIYEGAEVSIFNYADEAKIVKVYWPQSELPDWDRPLYFYYTKRRADGRWGTGKYAHPGPFRTYEELHRWVTPVEEIRA